MASMVLVIAPHMDDEVLGCGGTIRRHVEQKDRVEVVFVCNRAYRREYDPQLIAEQKENALKAKQVLGYERAYFLDLPDEQLAQHFQAALDGLEQIVQDLKPAIVYTAYAGDLHQDHQTVAHASNIALRSIAAPFVRQIYAYEVPSGSEQTFVGNAAPFAPNVFVDIEQTFPVKLKAMSAYERESRRYPHPRSEEMLKARAQYRGAQSGCAMAEAFSLLRLLK